MRLRCVSSSAAYVATLAAFAPLAPVLAQGAPECRSYAFEPRNRNICSAAVDATRALSPIAGILFSGGNPVPGAASTLGVWRGSVALRTTVAHVVLPDTDYDGVDNTVGAGDQFVVPMPTIEGALGVFNGLDGGFLSLDLLASVQPLPDLDRVHISREIARVGRVAFGLGAGVRVGLMSDSGSSPGLSVSIMRRDLPQVKYGDLESGDDYTYAVDLAAWNVRVALGKRISFFDFVVGLGWDRYFGTARAEIQNSGDGFPDPPINIELSDRRWLLFGNAGLTFGPLRVVGEAGYLNGKDQNLSTDFKDFDPTKGTWFGGLGIRVGLF